MSYMQQLDKIADKKATKDSIVISLIGIKSAADNETKLAMNSDEPLNFLGELSCYRSLIDELEALCG